MAGTWDVGDSGTESIESRAPIISLTRFCSTIVFNSLIASSIVSFFERRKLPFLEGFSMLVFERLRPIEKGEGLLIRSGGLRMLLRELHGRDNPGISSSN
jgi:hypothetical protein